MGIGLTVAGVDVSLGGHGILRGFSLTVGDGERVAITGPSGTGKSTLLDLVVGTRRPDSGTVMAGDVQISGLSDARRRDFRRRECGLLYQSPDLLPELVVWENVALLILFDGVPRSQARDRAVAALAEVGLAGHELKRVDEISGGEAQRVALARALIREEAGLLVADEPTASLDSVNAVAMAELIVERTRDRGMTAVVATHDPAVAGLMDRVVDLSVAGAEAA